VIYKEDLLLKARRTINREGITSNTEKKIQALKKAPVTPPRRLQENEGTEKGGEARAQEHSKGTSWGLGPKRFGNHHIEVAQEAVRNLR